MADPEKKQRNRWARLIPLLLYTLVLGVSCQLYQLGARYELFMQTLDTLWPIAALTALLLTTIASALLLAMRFPLWLVVGAHVLAVSWWLFSLPMGGENLFTWVVWEDSIPLLIALPAGSLLPPLLGYALLRLREKKWRRMQESEAAEGFSLLNPADILAGADAREAAPAEDDAEGSAPAGNDTPATR